MSSEKQKQNVFKSLKDRLYGFSYTTRVTVTFALIAVMTATVAVGVLSYVWEQHFQVYTRENVQTLAEKTAENIGSHYVSAHKKLQQEDEAQSGGEGACFTILIPLYDYDRIKALKDRQDGAKKPNGKGKGHSKGRKQA